MSLNKNIDMALAYAEMGWPVLPCARMTKIPIGVPNGVYDASTDEAWIKEIFTQYPTANVAIAVPPNQMVLDIEGDVPSDLLGDIPRTVTCKTPRAQASKHLYFTLPDGVELNTIIHLIQPTELTAGVDVITNKHYVMAPYSIHPNGGVYQWEVSPKRMKPVLAPDWLIQLCQKSTSKTLQKDEFDSVQVLNGIKEGGRQVALYRFACSLRARNVKYSEALVLMETAASNCSPPFTERSVEGILKRVYTKYNEGPSTTPKKVKKFWKLKELLSNKAEVAWYIERILPQGFTLLSGDPKLGKSLLMANLALSVAEGTVALGEFPTNKSDVLYLDLEQGETTSGSRFRIILGDREEPEGFTSVYDWDPLDIGGLDELVNYLNINHNTKLIIIDVIAKVWPTQDFVTGTAYTKDYAVISKLAAIARDFGIAIVGIHHNTKGTNTDFLKRASGSMGMTAASDTIWSLSRNRDSERATLEVTGKNVPTCKINLMTPDEGFHWYAV